MKEEEKISVIVPVYRVEAYLPCCLDSILAQSHSNLEIILVDDGSPDRSGEICDAYAKKDPRIKVIHQKNQGVCAARNAGLAAATGDWISFVDGDDWIDSEMYAYLLDLAGQYDSDLVQCGIVWEEPGYRKTLYTPHSVQEIILSEAFDLQILLKYLANSCCCKLFRKSKIAEASFDLAYPIGEDALFCLNALSLCGKIVLGNKAYYHYQQNPISAYHTFIQDERIKSARRMFRYAEKKFAEQEGIMQLCRNGKLLYDFDICSKLVCYHMEENHRELVRDIRKEMRELCRERFAKTDFQQKERLKAFLIGYAWPFYQWGLPKWKRMQRKYCSE